MIELLSPAGDEEKMRVAFNYGADAVYFGGQNYSLRANAKNFNNEEIKNAVILAHGLNKKVYVTVNIIFHDEDFEGLEEYLKKDGVVIIEWADMIESELPEERLEIKFKITGEEKRTLTITPYGSKYEDLCEDVL